LLKAANIECTYDNARGFDHGVFIPLKVTFPSADVPIVQVSLLASMDPAEHIRLGQALAPLRDEGVLIIGSGMSYHHMRTLMSHMPAVTGVRRTWVHSGLKIGLSRFSPERHLMSA
jgi:aromatic ring-opening dioxygenase catalytic subunit (LigB family)